VLAQWRRNDDLDCHSPSSLSSRYRRLDARRMRRDLDAFGIVPGPVVMQAPGRRVARLAFLNAYDDVAVPRPRVVAVVFARARRRVRMRMIPSDQLEMLLARRLFGQPDVVRGHLEAVSRGIVPPVCERQQVEHLARVVAIAAEQSAATLVRIGFDAVRVNPAKHFVPNLQACAAHSSLQNRSLKYFSPESG